MATMCPRYVVREATRADIPAIKALVDADDWDEYDLNFLYCMFDLNSSGWFVAEADTGDIIGVMALMRCSSNVVAGGLLVVKECLRGRGIGRAFQPFAENAVGDSSVVISANSVSLYESRNFTYDYDIYYKRAQVGTLLSALPVSGNGRTVDIVLYTDEMFSGVNGYDSNLCKFNRSDFCKNWNIRAATSVLVARAHTGSVVGYACLRMLANCHFIGPLYADSSAVAWLLMEKLLLQLESSSNVDLFVSSVNRPVVELLDTVPTKNLVTLHRMHRNNPVDVDMKKVFCLSHLGLTVV